MTYVASVVASNPQNYWRLNEGAGATAALDYGNFPGMLWYAYQTVGGQAVFGPPGFGFGGITADGGSFNTNANGLWNRVNAAVGAANPYTPLPDPGSLEFWYFTETVTDFAFLGWFNPGSASGFSTFGVQFGDTLLSVNGYSSTTTNVAVSPRGIWHHVALSWTGVQGFVYLDGAAVANFDKPAVIPTTHVDFLCGPISPTPAGINQGGLITEVATYRRSMAVSDFTTHRSEAELAGQRPHWIGQRFTSSSSSAPPLATYTTGVTHVGITGTGQLSLPTGLRGLKIDITTGPTGTRVLPGVPPYIFDVGWLSILDPSGMLAEIRPNRDTRTWLPDNMGLATSFGWALNPGVVVDVTELDPA